jgi:hypothetical protein
MGALDNIAVNVQVSLDAAPLGVTSFGTPMLLSRLAEDSYAMGSVDANSFQIADTAAGRFKAGDYLRVVGSVANDGIYQITTVSGGGGSPVDFVTSPAPVDPDDETGTIYFIKARPISTWVPSTKVITVTGATAADFPAGMLFYGEGTALNDTYTVVSSATSGGNALVTVAETLPSHSGSGQRAMLCYLDGDPELRTKVYTSNTAVVADEPTLGDTLADKLAVGFSQTRRPASVLLGVWRTGETAEEALDACATARAGSTVDFYGFCLNSRLGSDLVTATNDDTASAWAEAQTKPRMFIAQDSDVQMIASTPSSGIAYHAKALSLKRTLCMYHPTDSEVMDWALSCYFFADSPDRTSSIMAYRTLSGVTVQSYSGAEINNAKNNRVTLYTDFRGAGAVWQPRMADNNPPDLRLLADWLEARVSEAVAQVLVNASNRGSKIPYTDAGFTSFTAVTMRVLGIGEQLQHLEAGSSAVIMPKRADISSGDVAARHLAYTFGARPAGAVETVAITGTVSVDFTPPTT